MAYPVRGCKRPGHGKTCPIDVFTRFGAHYSSGAAPDKLPMNVCERNIRGRRWPRHLEATAIMGEVLSPLVSFNVVVAPPGSSDLTPSRFGFGGGEMPGRPPTNHRPAIQEQSTSGDTIYHTKICP